LGYRGITGDILDSNNSIIITLDDNSIIYSDLKIPEIFAPVIKKGLPIKAKFSGSKDKVYNGMVYAISSRINAETRSLLIRIKIDNQNSELIPGSLLEVTINYNERNSLGIPDTSIMLEGEKIYVYKVSEQNITNKTEIKIGIRDGGYIEVISGLNHGENIVAEGLKKVRPRGKIKPIKK
jgi:membrane fusion protein (multidrug efflux system)